jgi:hypothetical protein
MDGCCTIITRGKNRGKKCKDIHKYCHNNAHREESVAIMPSVNIRLIEEKNSNNYKINKDNQKNDDNSNKNDDNCNKNNDNLIYKSDSSLATIIDSLDPDLKCKYCNKIFSHKTHMYRHQKHRCKSKTLISASTNLNSKLNDIPVINIDELHDIEDHNDNSNEDDNDIRNAPQSRKYNIRKTKDSKQESNGNYTKIVNTTINTSVNNNFIQIICVGKNDDFYKILSARMGEKEAGEYILNCAKNNLDGDLNLLKKIYFEGKSPAEYPIKFLDKSRKKVQFLNENKELYVDSSGSELARRLCSSLQNGYLLQVNQIIEANTDQKDDAKFMDEFDIYNCHNHIYELSDKTYRKKLITSLGDTLGTCVV